MWCYSCRQDVPGTLIPDRGQICCPRCAEPLNTAGQCSPLPNDRAPGADHPLRLRFDPPHPAGAWAKPAWTTRRSLLQRWFWRLGQAILAVGLAASACGVSLVVWSAYSARRTLVRRNSDCDCRATGDAHRPGVPPGRSHGTPGRRLHTLASPAMPANPGSAD